MNSTDDDAMAARLGALFDELVLPLAQRLRHEGKEVFPLAPDRWWFQRSRKLVPPPASGVASLSSLSSTPDRPRRRASPSR